MTYIGIVGSSTPLGQKVVEYLKKNADLYRIVFYVDESYNVNRPAMATYASVEAALSFNQCPTLIIDCGDSESAIDRAKTYRFYSCAAIMCCTCSPENLETLNCAYVADGQAPSLLIVPDYSPRIALLMNFFIERGRLHRDNLDRFEIRVVHSLNNKVNFNRWLCWASLINKEVGFFAHEYKWDGDKRRFGIVNIQAVEDASLSVGGENVSVTMYYGNKEHLCNTFINEETDDYVADCQYGIVILLTWFVAHPDEIASGKVFTNHFVTAISDYKKNLH